MYSWLLRSTCPPKSGVSHIFAKKRQDLIYTRRENKVHKVKWKSADSHGRSGAERYKILLQFSDAPFELLAQIPDCDYCQCDIYGGTFLNIITLWSCTSMRIIPRFMPGHTRCYKILELDKRKPGQRTHSRHGKTVQFMGVTN